eukprot:CAMPEP_0204493108 /NCGR_PEP_ID=MMETSP0471-20130131/81270_1 /ASSEMBLY_ACC=CAM_ASM_000602 /TAXON_ID=2969 /ORGANISM="Oxyrrhis marina" /LENGTH=40 /DNA_ID= /DNA_START= /DNA_END= /DNA_ORIENTATION=
MSCNRAFSAAFSAGVSPICPFRDVWDSNAEDSTEPSTGDV